MEIREATEEDLPQLVALYQQLASEGTGITLERARELFERIRAYPDYKIYVANDGINIIGTFALIIFEALGFRAAPVGVVEDVVVSELARGRGIGKKMMQYAIDRCAEAGCYKMMLSSNLKREDAHVFYESIGFERHGYSFRVAPRKQST